MFLPGHLPPARLVVTVFCSGDHGSCPQVFGKCVFPVSLHIEGEIAVAAKVLHCSFLVSHDPVHNPVNSPFINLSSVTSLESAI